MSRPVKTTVFLPPKYESLSKGPKDLFKKRFEFTNSLKTIHRSSNGVTFESGVVSDASPLRGYVKTKLKQPKYEVEVEAQTEASQASKLTVRAPYVYPGVQTSASVSAVGKTLKYAGDFEYTRENLTFTGEASSDLEQHKARFTASAGIDVFTVGASVDANLTSGAELKDYAFAAKYTGPQFNVTAWTENKLDTANFAYVHFLPSCAVAGMAKVDISGAKTPLVSVATEYSVDLNTVVKAKVDAPTGATAVAIGYRLSSPKALVELAAAFSPLNFSKGVQADKFGAQITFGDY